MLYNENKLQIKEYNVEAFDAKMLEYKYSLLVFTETNFVIVSYMPFPKNGENLVSKKYQKEYKISDIKNIELNSITSISIIRKISKNKFNFGIVYFNEVRENKMKFSFLKDGIYYANEIIRACRILNIPYEIKDREVVEE